MAAWIEGKPVTLQAATAEAARVLAESRLPVIAGLGTDIAGVRAAVALARLVGGAIDHMHADALLRDLDVMREAGMMVTTPNEARLRGDLLLIIGDAFGEDARELRERLLNMPSLNMPSLNMPTAPDAGAARRRVVWLCPPRQAIALGEGGAIVTALGHAAAELPALLAALRARIAGRAITMTAKPLKALDAVAVQLKAARFGVAIWSAACLDALAVDMLCGLVDDLNAATRFTGLPLAPADNARGVLEACGWLTGYPMRTGFGRGDPEHDLWRFDAARLIDSGEGDCAVWISAYRAAVPTWSRDVPTIALTPADAEFRAPPHVQITVGRPGVDGGAVEYRQESGTLMPIVAMSPSDTVSVARAIADIAAALPDTGAGPC